MGGTRVGPQAIREYLARMRERYPQVKREEKGRLLTEVCEVTGYHRKAAIRVLRRGEPDRPRRRRGRAVRYAPAVIEALRAMSADNRLRPAPRCAGFVPGGCVRRRWINEDPLRELADEDERRVARRSDWRED